MKSLLMKRHRVVSLVACLTTAIVGVSGSATLAAASDEIYNFGTNQCLQPVNGSTTQGAAIVQEPCNKGAAQQWNAVAVGNNIFHYVNVVSGLCLDARGGAVNHTPIQQWTCNSISNEKWQPGDVPSDYIPPLISRVSGSSGYCLDIPGDQNVAGLAMQIYRCNGTEAQQWWTPYP